MEINTYGVFAGDFIATENATFVWNGRDFVKLLTEEEIARNTLEQYEKTIHQQFAEHPNALKPGQSVSPKRNKQVDVPTEAWQKNVERRLKELELLLCASEYPDARYGRKWETNFGTVEIPGHIIASDEKYEHPKVKVVRLQMELDSGECNMESAKHRLEIAKREVDRI